MHIWLVFERFNLFRATTGKLVAIYPVIAVYRPKLGWKSQRGAVKPSDLRPAPVAHLIASEPTRLSAARRFRGDI